MRGATRFGASCACAAGVLVTAASPAFGAGAVAGGWEGTHGVVDQACAFERTIPGDDVNRVDVALSTSAHVRAKNPANPVAFTSVQCELRGDPTATGGAGRTLAGSTSADVGTASFDRAVTPDLCVRTTFGLLNGEGEQTPWECLPIDEADATSPNVKVFAHGVGEGGNAGTTSAVAFTCAAVSTLGASTYISSCVLNKGTWQIATAPPVDEPGPIATTHRVQTVEHLQPGNGKVCWTAGVRDSSGLTKESSGCREIDILPQ